MFDFSTPITRDYTFKPSLKCGSSYDDDVLLVVKQTSGNGEIWCKNIWGGDITINGATVASGAGIAINLPAGGEEEITYRFSDASTPRTWNKYDSFIRFNGSAGVGLEFKYANVDAILNPDGSLPTKAFYRFFAGNGSLGSPITSIANGAFDFTNVLSIGSNCFQGFLYYYGDKNSNPDNIQGLTSLPDNLFVFPNVTSFTASGAFSNMLSSNYKLTSIGNGNFVFPALEQIADSFNNIADSPNHPLTTIGENCFQFPNLKTFPRVGNYIFEEAFKGSALSSIGHGSFLFPSLESLSRYMMRYTFEDCANLTALPIGSFNWPMTVVVDGYAVTMCDSMLDNSGVAVPGNGSVAINAPLKIWNSVLPNIEAGDIWYVNGE